MAQIGAMSGTTPGRERLEVQTLFRTFLAGLFAAMIGCAAICLLDMANSGVASFISGVASGASVTRIVWVGGVSAVLWMLMGLCFGKEPFGLFLWLGPVSAVIVGLPLLFFASFVPFLALIWLAVSIPAGLAAAASTWLMLNWRRNEKKHLSGFPIMTKDER